MKRKIKRKSSAKRRSRRQSCSHCQAIDGQMCHPRKVRDKAAVRRRRRRPPYPRGKSKITKVLREFRAGKLRSSSGRKVISRRQALAIAMSEQRRREHLRDLPSRDYIVWSLHPHGRKTVVGRYYRKDHAVAYARGLWEHYHEQTAVTDPSGKLVWPVR